jgi:hypothetical protein
MAASVGFRAGEARVTAILDSKCFVEISLPWVATERQGERLQEQMVAFVKVLNFFS